MYGKWKRDWTFPRTVASLRFRQYNLLPSILALLFIDCSEFIFLGNCLPSNSRTNTVNLGPTCQSTQNATRGAIFLRIVDWTRYLTLLYLSITLSKRSQSSHKLMSVQALTSNMQVQYVPYIMCCKDVATPPIDQFLVSHYKILDVHRSKLA